HLGNAMPREPRLPGHVDGIPRPYPQQQIRLAIPSQPLPLGLPVPPLPHVIRRDHEEGIATDAEADEPPVRLLAHVAEDDHGVPRRVEVAHGGLATGLPELALVEAA